MKKLIAVLLLAPALALAAVTTTLTEQSYTCGSTSFSIPFRFLDQSHLVVTRTSLTGLATTLTLGNDYTITKTATGGTLTLGSLSKCPSGTLKIKRATPKLQPTALRGQGTYTPATHEDALDRVTMAAQEIDQTRDADKAAQAVKDAAQDATYAAVNTGNVSTAHNTGWINVQEAPYSAKCDGTTDDAPALSAAQLASFGTTIVIPCRMKIASPVGVTSISNQNFGIGNGSQTVFPLGTSVTSATITQAGGDWQGTRTMYATPRTNLITYSDQADNAAWVKGNATVTANSIAAPDGTTTADTFTDTGTNAQHSLLQSATVVAGSTVVASRYVKAGTSSWAVIHTGVHSAKYDLSGGVASLRSGTCTFGMTSAGSGWWRIWISWTEAGTSASPTLYLSTDGTTISFAGTGLSLYTWRAQTEVGATTPTTSIQTTATAASVTDYTLTAGIVTFAAAPNSGALLSFSSSYTQSVTSPLRFEGAGRLVTYPGGSVTLAGPVLAGASQIFDTTNGGTFTFAAAVPWVYPEWWGAKRDGATDDTAAVQAAITAGYGKIIMLQTGNYRIASGPLVVQPLVNGTSQSPTVMRGTGADGNGGSGGTYFTVIGATDGIQLINSTGTSLNNTIIFEDFAIYGDGTNAAGGNGITAQRSAGAIFRRVWIQGMRGNGINLTDMWGALLEDLVVNSNRGSGIYVDKRFNNGVIRRCKVMGNGRAYSQQSANIYMTGGTNFESLGAVIEATDWSYAGGSPFQAFKTSNATITNVVVASNVATVTTSTAHGLSVGNKITVNGAATTGLDTTYPYTIASTPLATTFTFATSGVANGTYTSASDPFMIIGPSSFGLFISDVRGLKIIGAYAEDTSDSLIYVAGNAKGVTISGGYFQGQWVLIDSMVGGEIGGVDFAPGQRNASAQVGVISGVADFDVRSTNVFETNTRFSKPPVWKRDGVYYAGGAPGSGTWALGDVVRNHSPAIGSPPGWVRLTTGSGNVLNTDWRAMPVL